MLVFYDSLVEKTNCRIMVVFESLFSFSLVSLSHFFVPPWLNLIYKLGSSI